MRLSKAIERQLARIERTVKIKQGPTNREQCLAMCEKRYEAEWQKYAACIDLVLDGLEDEFFEMVVEEIDGAIERDEWESLDGRSFGDFPANGLSTLTNAVLAMAAAKYRGRQISPVIPRALCEYFVATPIEKFAYQSGGGGFGWLTSGVKCEECACPLPASFLGSGGLYGVRQKRDEPGECPELPFKRCPACGGKVEWSVKQL